LLQHRPGGELPRPSPTPPSGLLTGPGGVVARAAAAADLAADAARRAVQTPGQGGDRQGSRTPALVHADVVGDPGADHRVTNLKLAAGDRHLVRRTDLAVILLRLHGLREAALDGGAGGALASDPGSP